MRRWVGVREVGGREGRKGGLIKAELIDFILTCVRWDSACLGGPLISDWGRPNPPGARQEN